MSPSSLALSVLVAGFEGTTLPSELRALARQGLAGTIVFKRNFAGASPFETAAALLAEIAGERTPGAPLLSCIDEEGAASAGSARRFPSCRPRGRWGIETIRRSAGASARCSARRCDRSA